MYNIHSLGFDLSIAEVNKRSLNNTRRRASYGRVNKAHAYKGLVYITIARTKKR